MKFKGKKVSVIMNCYNGEEYLNHSIRSLISQTYNNWELIFWDNHSNDNSKNIVKSFKDPRIKYFFSKKYQSLHVARNRALKKCTGNYIAFLDTDDFWDKSKLNTQLKELEKKKTVMLYSNCWLLNENTFLKKKKITTKILPSGFIFLKNLRNYCIPLCTIVINHSFLKKNKLKFNESYNIIGDYDLVMRIALKNKIFSIQKPLATYRIHPKSYSINNKLMLLEEKLKWINYQLKSNLLKKDDNYNYIRSELLYTRIENNLKKKYLTSKNIFKKMIIFITLIINLNFNCIWFVIKEISPNFLKKKFFFFN
jgi:glycosyltransferase involved in cell wall biosynthesis